MTVALGAMEYMAVASKSFAEEHLSDGINQGAVGKAPSIQFDRKDTLPQQWMMLAFGNTGKLTSHYIPSYEGHLLACQRGIGWAMMPSVTIS